uniref:Uncharacterized protein n=1 Tax=Anopheles darlingi TaxID=43151 RepID=A0A2M4CWN6_ANODA
MLLALLTLFALVLSMFSWLPAILIAAVSAITVVLTTIVIPVLVLILIAIILTVAIVALVSTTLEKVTLLHFKNTLISIDQVCHFIGQLHRKSLQTGRFGTMHYDSLCRIIQ